MTPIEIRKSIAMIVAVVGLLGFVWMNWKIHQFSKQVASGEMTDPVLIRAYERARYIRWMWVWGWVGFAIIMWY